MSAIIIDGKEISKKVKEEVRLEVEKLKSQGIPPKLTVVLVGDDPASQVYVRNKEKSARKVGIESDTIRLPAETSEEELVELVKKLNDDESVNGILVQLPLPDHISKDRIIETISPMKDADGFHPYNLGRLMAGLETVIPCTPNGIMRMLDEIGFELKGKNAVVIGRSVIVGKPVAQLLLSRHATVTTCHSRTKNLEFYTKNADVLVVAVGRPEMIRGEQIKEGAVVIDVGINRKEDGKLVGDVHFESASEVASWITPVPGGVGPMTVAMLLYNTVYLTKKQHGIV